MDVVARTEVRRVAALARLDPKTRAPMGQFFTPAPAAALIASLPSTDGLTVTSGCWTRARGVALLGSLRPTEVVVPVRAGQRPDGLSDAGTDAPHLVPGGCSCRLRGVKIAAS